MRQGGAPTTIVIVEDESIVATDLALKLKQQGYIVAGKAADGRSAVEMVERLQPHLILLDIRLGEEMDGTEVAEIVRSQWDIPIVYLTAHSDSATLERAKLTGPFGYILKPFDERELKTQIELALHMHRADRLLREQRNWLQVTLASIGDAVITTDAKGNIIYINPVAEELTGWSGEEAQGEPLGVVFRIINEYSKKTVEDPVKKVLRTGKVVGLANHTLLLRKDGVELPIDDSGAPIRDGKGEVLGVVLVFRDISERRKAEAVIRESEERLRLFIEHAPTALAMFDKDMRYLSISRRWGSDYKLDERALIGKSHYEVFPEIPEHWKNIHASAMEGEACRADFDRLIREDGTVQWLHWEVLPWRDASGEIGGIVIFSEDVTDLKRSEDIAHDALLHLQEAVRAGNIGLWDWDLQSGKIKYSPEWKRQIGYDYYEIGDEFEEWRSRVHPEDLQAVLAVLYPEGGVGARRLEYRLRHKDGSYRWILIQASAIDGCSGRPVKMMGSHIDITLQKHAEEGRLKLQDQISQAQKLESIGRLAGGVAHDFNNMLGVILGHVELAMEQLEASSPIAENLEEIRKAARRSADLTSRLLGFARKQSIVPRILDLNETISSMTGMLRRLIGEDIRLIWNPGSELWRVKIDPAQADQILANLCVNARDAINGQGSIAIAARNVTFTVEDCDGTSECLPGEFVEMSVSDDGCGIDEETQKKMFEPFFTTKDVGDGTGLGLSMIYGIIKQNGGFITVESQPDTGAVFRVYIPRNNEKSASRPVPGAGEMTGGSETILLVEDEPSILDLARTALQRLGYRVVAESSPRRALAEVKQRRDPFDLLISDVVMPQMNGQQLLEAVERLSPGIRVLFMSGYGTEFAGNSSDRAPDKHFLQKPFSMRTLASKVREVLDGNRQNLERRLEERLQ